MLKSSFASHSLRALWIVALLNAAAPTAWAGHGQWQRLADRRGIHLWSLSRPGQSLPGFRGHTRIHGSLAQIAREMFDVPHHTEWMHRCAESWVYQRTGDTRGILYNRTSSAPWPVWDRDVVLEVHFDYAEDGQSLVVRFRNRDDLLRPVPERVVRMPKLEGYYKLVQLAPNLTSVMYQVEVDIGGSIPDWIAEEVAQDLPYFTLLSLRERVEGIAEDTPVLSKDAPIADAIAPTMPRRSPELSASVTAETRQPQAD